MADPTIEAPAPEQTAVEPELGSLVRVIFKGNAYPGDQTGEINLALGPNGESRTLSVGGSPQDALVTPDELHMLTGKFEIEIPGEQPVLSNEEVEAQTPPPLDDTSATQAPATLPNDNPDAEAPAAVQAATPAAQQPSEEEAEQSPAGDSQAQPAAQPARPSEQAPQAPVVPSPEQRPTPERGAASSPSGPEQTLPAAAPQPTPTTTTP